MGNTFSNSTMGPVADWLAVAGIEGFVLWALKSRRSPGTKLRGPPRASFLYGQTQLLRDAEDAAADIQAEWANQYGTVFSRPAALGKTEVVVTDTKALAHICAAMETTYDSTPARVRAAGALLGSDNILVAHGEAHKRQRRALIPGFTNAKIREYTSIFIDCAYKVKAAWDVMLETEESVEVDITPWMNAISLDAMGLAGFSHDFGAATGQRSLLRDLFDAFASSPIDFVSAAVLMLSPSLPILASLPTERTKLRTRFSSQSVVIARELLMRAAEVEGSTKRDDKSILGLLIKARTAETGFPMSEDEVDSQMKTLMVAGYETTSVTMTWAFIELCRRPELQKQLRAELLAAYPASDPTWDALNQELPLLDAIVHETLRLHPSIPETIRMPVRDDVVPLATPLALPNGQTTNSVVLQAKQTVVIPTMAINRLQTLWGPDAREFRPERWLDGGAGIPAAAKNIQGHRHLMTFIDGPRTCIGKGFAVAEFKAALSILIRNFEFELPNGPETTIRKHFGIMSRPKVEGHPQTAVPLRIRRIDSE